MRLWTSDTLTPQQYLEAPPSAGFYSGEGGTTMSKHSATPWIIAGLFTAGAYVWLAPTDMRGSSSPARQTPTTTRSTTPPTTLPQWRYYRAADGLTNAAIHVANFVVSKGPVYNVEVWVRCNTGTQLLRIGFEVGDFIGTSHTPKVEYRFDDGEVKRLNFSIGTEGKVIFVPLYRNKDFASSMMTHSRLRLRVRDYQGTAHDAEYPLRGSSKAISKVLAVCPNPRRVLPDAFYN